MLVAEAMSSHLVTLPPTATVAKAAEAMRDHDIGDVIVTDKSGSLVGIVTDRDVVTRVLAAGKSPKSIKLQAICSPDPVTVNTMDGVESAAAVMREFAIRRVPVVDNDGMPVGVITLGDIAHSTDRGSALADISRAPANH